MLEKTKLDRAARRLFFACEKLLRARAMMPVEPPPDFKDPLVAARLYIEAEEGRRAALAKGGVLSFSTCFRSTPSGGRFLRAPETRKFQS